MLPFFHYCREQPRVLRNSTAMAKKALDSFSVSLIRKWPGYITLGQNTMLSPKNQIFDTFQFLRQKRYLLGLIWKFNVLARKFIENQSGSRKFEDYAVFFVLFQYFWPRLNRGKKTFPFSEGVFTFGNFFFSHFFWWTLIIATSCCQTVIFLALNRETQSKRDALI